MISSAASAPIQFLCNGKISLKRRIQHLLYVYPKNATSSICVVTKVKVNLPGTANSLD